MHVIDSITERLEDSAPPSSIKISFSPTEIVDFTGSLSIDRQGLAANGFSFAHYSRNEARGGADAGDLFCRLKPFE